MQELKEEIRNHSTMERWNRLSEIWNRKFGDVDAIILKDSSDEDSIKLKTLALQSWLFRFEFTDSVVIISKTMILVYSRKDKLEMISHLVEKAKKQSKEIVLIEKHDNENAQEFEQLFEKIASNKLKKFGSFIKEKQVGEFIEKFEKEFAKKHLEEVDISAPFQEYLSVKLAEDVEMAEKCAKANVVLFQKLIQHIEDVLDSGKLESHLGITNKSEGFLKVHKSEIEKVAKVKPQFLEFVYSPVVQSGDKFNLKIDADSNNDFLSQNYILLNMGVKYFEINTNIFRTLLIDPNEADKNRYSALCKTHEFLIQSIKVGAKCNEIYNNVIKFVKNTYPDLIDALPQMFGFGIGYEFRESCLAINAKNEKAEIVAGQTFLLVTSLKDLKGRKNVIYSMHISDTVLATENGPRNLTSGVSKKIEDIGYNLNDEVSEKEEPKKRKENKTLAAAIPKNLDLTDNAPITARTRLAKRMEEVNKEQNEKKNMKNHQKELLRIKMEELEERLKSGNFNYTASESSKIVLEKIKAYTPETFPTKLNPKNIHVDIKKNSVLLPINNALVPFHVSCLKNVTKHTENKTSTLRFNFFTPGISSGNITFPSPDAYGSQLVYIKELTFRTSNIENFNQIAKEIKEIQKNLKTAINTAFENQDKLNLTNKLKFLNDIKMRPAMNGRKSQGTLTAYENGFRFTNKNTNENFDFPLSIVKHAILQLCDQDMIVIIHFALETPVTINKKSCQHVQFYTEVGYLTEDLNDPRRRNRGHDMDEFEEEELERQAREFYNKMFLEFCSYVEKHWKSSLKFDSPFPESSFYGSPFYNNVVISPASNCLVSLIEQPFLVVSYSDIELVSFERIDSQIKNFDMIVVFKDYTKPVQTITNIPKKKLDMIKSWVK